MTKYVALLRGIGPMNPNMKPAKLKECFEAIGFSNVRTVISSGNVVFDSPTANPSKLEATIEKALPQHLGFTSTTIIRSKADLEKLVAHDPYKSKTHSQQDYLLVTFFKHEHKIPFKLPYHPEDKPYTLLGQLDHAVYGTVDLTTGKTPDYMVWLEKQFTKDITSRTWLTIHRILKKMEN